METKDILITGGLGFVGSNLAKSLVEDGHNVTIVDCSTNHRNIWDFKDDVEIIRSCVATEYAWREYCKDKDTVIHLAANVSHWKAEMDPYIDINSNAVGMINLCEGIKSLGSKPRVIFSCSRSVYGHTQFMPVTEDHPTDPMDSYGISKLAAEKYLMKYSYHDDIPAISFRMANVVGPRQGLNTREYQMISWIFRRVALEEELGFWGDGLQTRDFLYVGDLVDVYKKAATMEWDDNYPLGDYYNLPGGQYTTWLDAIHTCADVLGKEPKLKLEPYPNKTRIKLENPHSCLNGDKLYGRFGIKPTTPLRVAFKKMAEYYPGRWKDYLHEGML